MLGLTFLINVSILIGVSAIRSGREEIIFPSMETLRSGEKRLSFRALNQDIALKLEAAGDLFGKGFSVEFARDGKSEIPKLNIEDIKRSLYKDKRTGASLHIKDKERILINGIINDNLRIEPIESEEGRRDGAIPHRIYEVISNDNSHISVNDAVFPTDYRTSLSNEPFEELRTGEPIYVEIGIVTDTLFTYSFQKYADLLIYLSVFLNAVQCRYDNIKPNKVVLILSHVEMNNDTAQEPYIQNHIVDGYLMMEDALKSFSIFKGNANDPCDIIMLISKRKMAVLRDEKTNTSFAGMAYLGRACDQQFVPQRTEKVGIISDQVDYENVNLFAHECAHLLGCPHDGDGPDASLPGHPGSSKCPWSDGYIMSYVDTINSNYFSSCCQENIRYLANRVDCLRINNTGNNIRYSYYKPGEYLESSLGLSAFNYENHKLAYYTYRCYNFNSYLYAYPDGKCQFTCQFNVNGQLYFQTHRCSDGEMCSVGKRCYNGVCM